MLYKNKSDFSLFFLNLAYTIYLVFNKYTKGNTINNRLTYIIIIAAFCMLILIDYSYAAPSIDSVSGLIVHGSSITLSGSNFGSKSPAKPLIWADFEDGLVNENSNLCTGNLITACLSIDNTSGNQPHPISNYCVRGQPTPSPGARCTLQLKNEETAGNEKWYSHVRLKFDDANWWNNLQNATNIKIFRPEPPGSTWYPNFIVQIQNLAQSFTYSCELVGSSCLQPPQRIAGSPPVTQTWIRTEVELYQGTLGNKNGEFRYWQNGLKNCDANIYGRCAGADALWGIVNWQCYQTEAGRVPAGAYLYYDDFYLDNTWARVMIGNNSTFSSSTHREIQIPSAWSDTSITITLNQGSFANCETIYLFVVDADGNVNTAGYPIRFVTGAGEPPCPPIGEKISK